MQSRHRGRQVLRPPDVVSRRRKLEKHRRSIARKHPARERAGFRAGVTCRCRESASPRVAVDGAGLVGPPAFGEGRERTTRTVTLGTRSVVVTVTRGDAMAPVGFAATRGRSLG